MSPEPPDSTPPPPSTPPEVEDAALRGATKEDIAKLEAILKARAIPSPPAATTPPSTTIASDDQLELEKYRESERKTLLKEMPKAVIEQFKLEDKPLQRVKEIDKLTKALLKKDVGVQPPPPSTETHDKTMQWNPVTGKNELC